LPILFLVLWHTDDLGNSNSIQMTESLTYRPLGQLPIPLVLHLLNLPLLIQMNRHHTLNRLFLVNALDHISGLQIHQNRVPGICHLVVQTLNLAERLLQPVPLCSKFVAAGSDGEWVGECGIVSPEREFGERGAAREEVEDGADNGLLLVGEGDAGGGGDVFGFDVEV